MKDLRTKDWMILNNIIYKIHTTEDLTAMRQEFLEQMKFLIAFDSADFYLADLSGEGGLGSPVTFRCKGERCMGYEETGQGRRILYGGKSIVCRESDLIPDRERVQSDYYKKIYIPNNWEHALHLVLANQVQCLGIVTFYRTVGKDDFGSDDLFLLELLKEHMTYRLETFAHEQGDGPEKITISKAVRQYELTKREETILRLLLAGCDNEAICEKLVISINTLKKHVLNIYRKLGIKNRVQMFKMIRERE